MFQFTFLDSFLFSCFFFANIKVTDHWAMGLLRSVIVYSLKMFPFKCSWLNWKFLIFLSDLIQSKKKRERQGEREKERKQKMTRTTLIGGWHVWARVNTNGDAQLSDSASVPLPKTSFIFLKSLWGHAQTSVPFIRCWSKCQEVLNLQENCDPKMGGRTNEI